ncbi:type II secretion system protein [Caminibacter mediatlanticus TB-2]|uniref:Type II secretion system protein n=1 Tax=Caminibacter mediatlanticus TB-2 TaxID=391592 RepID=A0ABX5VD71_9BACT|nr:type II secretion system protein [Caminibacter mediatlanticus]QCT95001.1 type II secretion system protein [Caminibacter mediatlanticus TB-2]
MKKAFTMIELIFVIVILGILAAVALPKFIGVASQAREANLKSFTGTLNGTLGPSWWSQAMAYDGNISKLNIDTKTKLAKYTDVPKALTEFNLSECDNPAKYKVIAEFDKNTIGSDVNYYIACKDGTASEAPKFILIKPKATTDDGLSLGDANTSEVNSTVTEVTFKDANHHELIIQK